MTTQQELKDVQKQIAKLQKREIVLCQKLIEEENKAKGISFKGELTEIDFSDLEIDPAYSIEDNLADFIEDIKRDVYDFDTWDEVESTELNFIYEGKVYEVSIRETSCIESSHDGRIMDHDVTVKLVK